MRHSPSHGERMAVIKDVCAHIDDTTRHERRVPDLCSAWLRFHHSGEPSADNEPTGELESASLLPIVSEWYGHGLG